jgi:hypothetical protein
MDTTAPHPLDQFAERSPRAAERLAVAQELRAKRRAQDPASPVLAAVELIQGAATALVGHWSPAECERLNAAANLLLDMEADRVERHSADATLRVELLQVDYLLERDRHETADALAERGHMEASALVRIYASSARSKLARRALREVAARSACGWVNPENNRSCTRKPHKDNAHWCDPLGHLAPDPRVVCEHCGGEDAPHPECQIAAAMTLTTEVVTQGRGGLHTWRCNRCCAHWTAHASRCPHCDDPETPQPAGYKPPHCGDPECEPCEEARLRNECPTCWKGTNPEIPFDGDVWRCPTCGTLYEEQEDTP